MKKLIIILCCISLWSCKMDLQNNDDKMQNVRFITNTDGRFLYCTCSDSQTMELLWDYPVKPGMEEWKQLQTNREMLDACQIPENILSSLSTKELAAVCLQYPLLITTMFSFNIPDNGIDVLFDEFNGIRELYKRDGGAAELLDLYNCQLKNCTLLKNENFSDLDKGSFVFLVYTLEYLLSRATDNYSEVLQSLVTGYEKQSKYHPIYFTSLSKNFFSRGHIIVKICDECLNEEQKNKIFGYSALTDKEMDLINTLSYLLIK